MKLSYNWLKDYIKKLPSPQKITELLTMHSFEVKSLAKFKNDRILDLDVLPNRASDCLSHRGIAREISAVLGRNFSISKSKISRRKVGIPTSLSKNINEASGLISKQIQNPKSKISKPVEIKVVNSDLCPRYTAQVITEVKIKESPKWLKEKLEAIGQRSINNIVDATNYVMFDLGQPMHAFDFDKVQGGKIIVRKAKKKEKITTLEGEKFDLDENILVIADGKEPIALAGIKGGKKAEIDKKTKNIILESANFDPINIRRTSKKLNLKSESSMRFEAGLDPNLAVEALDRVAVLIQEIAGGNILKDRKDIYSRPLMPRKILFHPFNIKNLLGIEISEKEIIKILNSLGFEIQKINIRQRLVQLAKSLIDRPYRYGARTSDAPESFDCSSFTKYLYWQIGLEIPRISVEQFLASQPIAAQKGEPRLRRDKKDLKPGDLVFSKGRKPHYYKETPQGVGHCGIYIGNNQVIHSSSKKGKVVQENIKVFDPPIGGEWRGARRFLTEANNLLLADVPSWRLDVALKEDLIEEIARIFGYQKISSRLPEITLLPPKRNDEIYWENFIKDVLVGAGWSEVYNYSFAPLGKIEISNPISKDKKYLRPNLFFNLLENVRDNFRFFDKVKIFEIGKIFTSEKKMLAGALSYKKSTGSEFFEIKGAVEMLLNKMGLAEIWFKEKREGAEIRVAEGIAIGFLAPTYFEIDLEKLFTLATEEFIYRPFSKYPAVTRDIALLVDLDVRIEEVTNVIENSCGPLLIDVDLFDFYEGEEIPEGQKNLAFHLIFQSAEKTLTEEEINNLMRKISRAIQEHGWEIR